VIPEYFRLPDKICRGKPLYDAPGIAIGDGIKPADLLHRQAGAAEMAGICPHYLLVFPLGYFVLGNVKGADHHLVLGFVPLPGNFLGRASHKKEPTLNFHKIKEYIRLKTLGAYPCGAQREADKYKKGQ
jgi:hypothetical protein